EDDAPEEGDSPEPAIEESSDFIEDESRMAEREVVDALMQRAEKLLYSRKVLKTSLWKNIFSHEALSNLWTKQLLAEEFFLLVATRKKRIILPSYLWILFEKTFHYRDMELRLYQYYDPRMVDKVIGYIHNAHAVVVTLETEEKEKITWTIKWYYYLYVFLVTYGILVMLTYC
ncbi:hypothetical protein KJ865_06875, partial [Myxococcota bacterium]|nr:hypothetical protein [Myxococcota bacterium]